MEAERKKRKRLKLKVEDNSQFGLIDNNVLSKGA